MKVDVWTTKDGKEVPIKDMEDSHLRNTVAFLLRNVEAYRMRQLRRMSAYMAQAPDGAFDACEREADSLMEADPDEVLAVCVPQYRALKAEFKRRRLS